MTEPTINSTLYTFIEQVNFYDLQKMVLQFAMHFVSTLGYTYMVYTLHNWNKTFNTIIQYAFYHKSITGGSHLRRIFWEHENLSSLSIIRLIQLL